jgi:peptidoglycan-associated lipoprotein
VKVIRLVLTVIAVVALVALGASGCAKKQVKTEQAQIQPQQPAAPPEAPAAPEAKEGEGKVAEAPPGPKEQPEPVESARAEKALRDVHYDYDSFVIRPEDAAILQGNADWMKANPQASVIIEGHCDDRGTVEYNLALGERRAEASKNYMVSLGITPDKIKTISYGKSKPLDPAENEEAWAKNRRAHFVVQ